VGLTGRRVLVTGHNGFKGTWLTLWLEELGAEVTGLSAPEIDVRDAAAVRAAFESARPEVVFHLAAQPIVRRSYEDPEETYAVNVMGTVNVLDAVRAAGDVGAIVVITSDKCYLNRGLDQPFLEDDPLGGHDPYSASKAAQEIVSASYRDSFGLPLATARAGNVIGGGDWGRDRIVPDAMRAALAGEPVEVRNPAATRPWQHVLNPLSGYILLADRLLAGDDVAEGWNFGPPDDDARTVGWLIGELAGRWPGGIEVTGTTELDAPAEAATLKLDSSKARERLGWTPPVNLEDGLQAIVDWYSASRDGRDITLEQVRALT
jgi:CDP-glucose 4,6-dehydratase